MNFFKLTGFALMMQYCISGAEVRAQTPQLWVCRVTCAEVSTSQFKKAGPKKGLAGLKRAKEASPTWNAVNIWPIGYKFKLSHAGKAAPADDGVESVVCEGVGKTAELAAKSLHSRVTGENLPIMAVPCGPCPSVDWNNAYCEDFRGGSRISYSVLQSRLNPQTQSEPAKQDSTVKKAE